MNKKAIVFTFITIILVILLIAAFLLNISNRAQRDIQKTNIKIEALSSLVNSFNNEIIQESLRSSANQVFISFLDQMDNKTEADGEGLYKGLYLKGDLREIFADALLDGYYKNKKLRLMFQDNLNYTLKNSLEELKLFASSNGANFTYAKINKDSVNLFQPDPWHINASFVITYNINDSKNEISWVVQNKQISVLLSIESYREPLYLVSDQISVLINRTDVTTWTSSEFRRHITNRLFIEHPDAPSFLDRLMGDTKSGPNGIETILDPNFYKSNEKVSFVDFEYRVKVKGDCTVDGMPDEFRISSNHLSFYKQTGSCGNK